MKIIDITRTISADMEIYPGDAAPEIRAISSIVDGDTFNVSHILLGTHTGTHVDPPAHLISGGAAIDKVPLEKMVGHARLIDLSDKDCPIEPEDIGILFKNEIILLKGHGSGVRLSTAAAQYLMESGICTAGTDSLSIADPDNEYEVHQILLAAGILIIEGLDLNKIGPGEYFFICLPIKIAEGDGGPARAVLIKKENIKKRKGKYPASAEY